MIRHCALFLLISFSSLLPAAVPSIDDFKHLPTTIDAELSPNGRYLAILQNIDQRREVKVLDLQNNGTVVSKFGDIVVRPFNVIWATNDKLLVSIISPVFTDRVKRELENKHVRELRYPRVTRIVAITLGKKGWVEILGKKSGLELIGNLSRIENMLSDDNEHILVSVRKEGRLLLYKANINNGRGKLVERGGINTNSFITNKLGDVLYRTDYVRSKKEAILRQLTSEGKWQEVSRLYFDDEDTEVNSTVSLKELSGIMKDGSLIYRKRNPDTGYMALYRRYLDGKDSLFVSLKDEDILGVIGNIYTSEIIGFRRTKNEAIIEASWDKGNQSHIDKIEATFEQTDTKSFAIGWRNEDATTLLVSAFGMSSTGTIYQYDKTSGAISQLIQQNEYLPESKLAISTSFSYPARDGTAIPAFLLLPANFDGETALPTVVMPHGGPTSRYYDRFNTIAQFIATRGYVVVMPNFRGSSGYGLTFQKAGYKQWGKLMQRDVEDAAHFLITEKIADPEKVCILGVSYGGYSALMGALNDELFKCAVSVNGVTNILGVINFSSKKLKDNGFEQEIPRQIYSRVGHPEKDKKMLRRHSPLFRAKDMKVPILLMGGKKDSIVPFNQQQKMATALENAGKDFVFIEFEEGKHNPIATYQDIDIFYSELEKFLAKYLE